jgi:FkbM family methyltransferase
VSGETDTDPVDVLVGHLDRPLGVADIGCRWGFAEAWERLGESASVVGFDPDVEECARLRERYADRPNVQVVDRALASHAGCRAVHLTVEPACSSFFPPDPIVLAQVPDLAIMRPVGRSESETTTLDEWLQDTQWGPVDFIKADVQGAEAEVLEGATETLRDVVLMELEVEFNPLYEGQALFSDIDALARSRGFRLWRLSNLAHYTRHRSPRHPAIPDVHFCDSRPTHWESPGGQLFWAHALYVAKDVVERSGEDWKRSLRAGCLASALGLHDLALHAWTGSARAAPELQASHIRAAISDYGEALGSA